MPLSFQHSYSIFFILSFYFYCNDDNFQNYKINSIPICGKRKLNKALEALGDSDLRKTKLAPNWSDIIDIKMVIMVSRLFLPFLNRL